MNFFSKSTAARIRREARKEQPSISPQAVMQKTLIVKTRDGREVARHVIVSKACFIDHDYNQAYGEAIAMYPNCYFFCDHSEGRPAQ